MCDARSSGRSFLNRNQWLAGGGELRRRSGDSPNRGRRSDPLASLRNRWGLGGRQARTDLQARRCLANAGGRFLPTPSHLRNMNHRRLNGAPLVSLREGRGGRRLVNLRPNDIGRRRLQDGLWRELSLLGSPKAGLRLRCDLRMENLAATGKLLSCRCGWKRRRLRNLSLVVPPWQRGLNSSPSSTPQLGIPLHLKPESLGERLHRITGIHDGQQKQDRQRGELHGRKPQRCEGWADQPERSGLTRDEEFRPHPCERRNGSSATHISGIFF